MSNHKAMKSKHEALERIIPTQAAYHVYPEMVHYEILHFMRLFRMAERSVKLKPGQSINISLSRAVDDHHGDFIKIRADDRYTTPATPPKPQEQARQAV